MLEVEALGVGYGGSQVLFDVDLHVDEGELVTLIGSNGAGKSTLMKSICGQLVAWKGDIRLGGRPVVGMAVDRIVRLGLAHCPEGRRVFPQMTVHENLLMGAFTRPRGEVDTALDRVHDLFPWLRERRAQVAGTLSGGEQQMLAIARSLMCVPKLLLLDEPSLGLAPVVVDQMLDVVQTIANEGVTTLLVEQNARLALSVATRAYVLEAGQIVKEGTGTELAHDESVQRAYLGL
ncbi:MAG: ABC transporter ATP-binding protein [Egibacteraceae bacterium]